MRSDTNHASRPKKPITGEDLSDSDDPLGPPVHFGAPPLEEPPLDLKHPDSYYSPHIREFERFWVDRNWFFHDKGFELWERYRPGWIPSWLASGKDESLCEDGLTRMFIHIIDARRRSDGLGVVIKMVYRRKQEGDILRYLSSPQLLLDTTNHTVRVLGIFQDPYNPEIEHLVMPVLRRYDSPEFGAIGEVVDFVTQVLEGLVFMHSHGIAHNDCTENNIMMDGRPICPQGWNPIMEMFSPDCNNYAKTLARIDHPVQYFFTDFGLSHRFLPGQRHVVLDYGGADQDVPELRKDQPYDPFKLDVYTLANIFMKRFHQKYLGLEFLGELVDFMRVEKPSKRPTAQMSLEVWQSIKGGLEATHARWRLRKPGESMSERVVLDAVAAARSSIHEISRYFI
ncbi:kinase-like domain-containing protein [Crassisporium funariophilum]|nr:kinase-like domain-containing protein [Crassisporium funariophilum]